MSWMITDSYSQEKIVSFGNKYLLANGYMGYRGTLEEYGKKELVANTLLGVYDQFENKWREPVNAPNSLHMRLFCGDKELNPVLVAPAYHQQQLNYHDGIHSRETRYQLGENLITVTAERFVSMAVPQLLAGKIEIASQQPVALRIELGIDGDVWDINGPHLFNYEAKELEEALLLNSVTGEQKIGLSTGKQIIADHPYSQIVRTPKTLVKVYEAVVTPTENFSAIQFGTVNYAASLEAAEKQTLAVLKSAVELGYQDCRTAHQRIWQELWKAADIQIEGDAAAQEALRYSIYQLQSAAPRQTDSASIPARGLSGQTYKGAVFWDTEMFMLPFFLHTDVPAARRILNYRIDTLEGAKKKAQTYGFEGAFYAWESQENGYDATSDYNVTDVFTKRPMRTYFKDKQIHISSDIVHALWSYYEYTQDFSLLLAGGAEVIFECAKFYRSYSYFKLDKNRYELIDVIGPDEYHERVYNNAYTNKLASETVLIALELWDLLAEHHPKVLDILKDVCQINDRQIFEEFAAELFVPKPDTQTQLVEQFDGYFQLEDVSLNEVRSRLLNSQEYWGGAYGIAADTQIIKQADVMLMLYLFKEDYTAEIIQKNWNYYEPRTEHGSSLSACIYALTACEFGNQEWAYPYFMKTATVDLTGASKEYAGTIYIGGTHPAANGGAWMTAVLGFAGLKIQAGEVICTPRLPKQWQKMSFNVQYNNCLYRCCVTKDSSEVIKLSD